MTTATAEQAPPIDLDAIAARLDVLSADELKAQFFRCCRASVESITEAAMCVKTLKDRYGVDMRGVPGAAPYIRIAEGRLTPELYARFLTSDNLRHLERLSPEEQRRVAADPVVEIIEPTLTGKGFTTRRVDLTDASPDQIKDIIRDGRVLDPKEQAARRVMPRPQPPTDRFIEPVEPLTEKLPTVRATPAERAALQAQATIAGLSEADMIRRALIRAGAFRMPKS